MFQKYTAILIIAVSYFNAHGASYTTDFMATEPLTITFVGEHSDDVVFAAPAENLQSIAGCVGVYFNKNIDPGVSLSRVLAVALAAKITGTKVRMDIMNRSGVCYGKIIFLLQN